MELIVTLLKHVTSAKFIHLIIAPSTQRNKQHTKILKKKTVNNYLLVMDWS